MKSAQTNAAGLRRISLVLASLLATSAYPQLTDLSQTPLPTYSPTSGVDVKPNVLFVLDDSGSMDWDFMPDWATLSNVQDDYRVSNYSSVPPYLRYATGFNGLAYNPAIRYQPPAYFDSTGTRNTTRYPSMTGTSTTSGGDSSASSASPNWKAVPNDGYGVQSTNKTNLNNNAWSYILVAGEYCNSSALRNCTTSSTATGTYAYPAPLRWCTSAALTTCKATWDSSYKYPRAPAPRTATITVNSGSKNTAVNSIKVDSYEILSAATSASSTTSTVAQRIVDNINACTNAQTGNCTAVGYKAYCVTDYWSGNCNSNVVTILAPGASTTPPTITPGNTGSGYLTFTATSFDRQAIPLWPWRSGSSTSSSAVPGENLRHTITSSITSYPKSSARTDCTTNVNSCTYAEEMTNYANWWAYYRTRMQMMKTAASLAFAGLDSAEDIANDVSRFRVGYLSINDNNDDFVNLGEFKTTQKNSWYNKLFGANPNSGTPLREALSIAGRLYGGKLNGVDLNGSTVVDPLQYSCQQNYTILSTDGFWNGNAGYKLDGSTDVGNQDGSMTRPYNDGATYRTEQRTSDLQQRTSYQQADRGTLQKQISQLQTQTSVLQQRKPSILQQSTSSNRGNDWGEWTTVTTCRWDSSGRDQTRCRYVADTSATWSNVSTCTTQAKGTSNDTTWRQEVECQYSAWSGWANVATCSTTNRDSDSPYEIATARQCQTAVSSPYANATSCTPTTVADGNGQTIQCQYSWEIAVPTSTCTPAYVNNNYSNPTVYRNCTTSGGTWANVSSCTATSPNASGQLTECRYTDWTTWGTVSSCEAIEQSSSPSYTVAQAVECRNTIVSSGNSDTLADVAAYYYNTDLRRPSTDTGVASTDRTGTCTGPVISPSTTPNDLCANNVPTYGRDVSTKQHMTTFTLGLGAQGKMVYSDYQNDAAGARTYVPDYWSQVSGDFYDVKSGTTPNATNGICSWMTSGSCTWPTPSANDAANIDDLWHAAINGRGTYFSASDPTSLTASLAATLAQISLVPRPGAAAAAASSNPNISASDNYVFSSSYRSIEWWGELIRQQIDDNGQLSAQQWSAMQLLDCATTAWAANHSYAVGDAFKQGGLCYRVVAAHTSGSTFDAASASIAQIVPECASWSAWVAETPYAVGDTFREGSACYRVTTAFTSGTSFTTSSNFVDVQIAPITRNIYVAGSSGLATFDWDHLSSAQRDYFKKAHIALNPTSSTTNAAGLSQFCAAGATCLSSTAQDNNTVATGGAAGEALVNFLRGDRSNEGVFYRSRTHVLGDIVSSEARYVKTPMFNYTDAGYSDYKTLHKSRAGAVYVAANDGMLHAFDAITGQENWAFIPSAVLPNLYKLADINYATKHQFMVDGSPEIGEICPTAPTTPCTGSQWRTILVGGLNAGGKAYYALDITNPASPTLLWEFTDANLGYTYGNPRITKLKNGRWVVMFTSGYNNSNGTDTSGGDGEGRLYIVDAYTGGTAITGTPSISTGIGTVATPSGLSKIAAHVPLPMTNNTVQAVYGGDLLGNLWRFDVNGDIGTTGIEAHRLISFTDDNNNVQPIMAKPIVTTVNYRPVVYVGTGRYLGTTDVSSSRIQSFYAVKDNLNSTSLTNPRTTGSGFVEQTLTSGTCPDGAPANVCSPGQSVRTTSNNAVNLNTGNGWYIDFLNGGERSTTDPALGLGLLMFTTIQPNLTAAGACGVEGTDTSSSFIYSLNYLTGTAVSGAYSVGAASLGLGLATRPVLIRQGDGTVRALIRMSSGSGGTGTDGGRTVIYTPNSPSVGGTARRVSWRELNGE